MKSKETHIPTDNMLWNENWQIQLQGSPEKIPNQNSNLKISLNKPRKSPLQLLTG